MQNCLQCFETISSLNILTSDTVSHCRNPHLLLSHPTAGSTVGCYPVSQPPTRRRNMRGSFITYLDSTSYLCSLGDTCCVYALGYRIGNDSRLDLVHLCHAAAWLLTLQLSRTAPCSPLSLHSNHIVREVVQLQNPTQATNTHLIDISAWFASQSRPEQSPNWDVNQRAG